MELSPKQQLKLLFFRHGTLRGRLTLWLVAILAVGFSVESLHLFRVFNLYRGYESMGMCLIVIGVCCILTFVKCIARFEIFDSIVAGRTVSIKPSHRIVRLGGRLTQFQAILIAIGGLGLTPILTLSRLSPDHCRPIYFYALVTILGSLPSLLLLYGLATVGDELLVPILYGSNCGSIKATIKLMRMVGGRPQHFARWLLIRSFIGVLRASLSAVCALLIAILIWIAFLPNFSSDPNVLEQLVVGAAVCWLPLQILVIAPPGSVFATMLSLSCLEQMGLPHETKKTG